MAARALAPLLLLLPLLGALAVGGVQLNFTLVDTDLPNDALADESFVGFVLAAQDANAGAFGLFPQGDVQVNLVDRVVRSDRLNNMGLSESLVAMVLEDNPAGVLGGVETATALLTHTVLQGNSVVLPHVGTSAVKHLPLSTRNPFYSASPDASLRFLGLADFLHRHDLNTVTILVEKVEEAEVVEVVATQELVHHGLRVLDSLEFHTHSTEAELGALWATARAHENRVFLLACSVPALETILQSAHDHNMTRSDNVFLFWENDEVARYLADGTHPSLAALVREAHLIGPGHHSLNRSSPAFLAADERARELPSDHALFADYDPSEHGLSELAAFAYDSAIALFSAVNLSMAEGYDALDASQAILHFADVDFEGITGRVRYNEELEVLASVLDIVQFVPSSGSADANDTLHLIATYSSQTHEFHDVADAVWADGTTTVPSNFRPESCGASLYRSLAGFCVACEPNMYNPPDDLLEECRLCDLGSELHGVVCVQCTDDEDAVRGDSGEPLCTPKEGSGVDVLQLVLIVAGAFVGTVVVAGSVIAVLVKLRRSKQAIAVAQMRAMNAQFIAYSFHEMRNPLNGVAGSLEFALSTLAKLRDVVQLPASKPAPNVDSFRKMPPPPAPRAQPAAVPALAAAAAAKPPTPPGEASPVIPHLESGRGTFMEVASVLGGNEDADNDESGSEAAQQSHRNRRESQQAMPVDEADADGAALAKTKKNKKNESEAEGEKKGSPSRFDEVMTDLREGQLCLVDTVHVLDTINMLSQVINGVCSLDRLPTCPKELVDETLHIARELAPSEGVSISLDASLDGAHLPKKTLLVLMDRAKLRQALLILTLNALRYTQNGVVKLKVDVRTKRYRTQIAEGNQSFRPPQSPNRAAHGSKETVTVRFEVLDTGSGIPPDDVKEIFDLQHQIVRGGSVRNTGLGLVLASEICKLHGSTLHVASKCKNEVTGKWDRAETGTRFWWTLHTEPVELSPRVGQGKRSHGGSASEHSSAVGSSAIKWFKKRSGEARGSGSDKGSDKGSNPSHGGGGSGAAAAVAKPAFDPFTGKPHPVPPHDLQRSGSHEGSNVMEAHSVATSAETMSELLESMPRGLRILLLEDVALNRKVMRRKLTMPPFKQLEWEIEEAETGEKCLAMVIDEGRHFDLVFCDQILSNAGGKLLGCETAVQLRQWEEVQRRQGLEVKEMVLVACSGNASDEDKKIYMQSGMNGVIAKPLPDQIQLLKAIHRVVVAV